MRRYGWFEYEKNPREITNYLTNQKLIVLSGNIEVAPPSDLVCKYVDDEINYLIQISFNRENPSWTSILLDYAKDTKSVPEYGHWRRIDDFLTDVLSCWRVFLDYTEEPFLLTVVGGWRSGSWQPRLKRVISVPPYEPEQTKKYPISEPYVIPLNVGKPKRWRYFDHKKPSEKAGLQFQCAEPLFIPYINGSDTLIGFQGAVPYLEREDKKAYIFPTKLEFGESHGAPRTLVWYTYIDQDIFFSFHSSSTCKSINLFGCRDYGFRQLPPAREFWTADPMGRLILGDRPRPPEDVLSQYSFLSYRVWREVISALGDAWPIWKTPPRKIESGPSVELYDMYKKSTYTGAFVGDYGPTMDGGYSAGFSNHNYKLRFPAN